MKVTTHFDDTPEIQDLKDHLVDDHDYVDEDVRGRFAPTVRELAADYIDLHKQEELDHRHEAYF